MTTENQSLETAHKQLAEIIDGSEIRQRVIDDLGQEVVEKRIQLCVKAVKHLDVIKKKQQTIINQPDNSHFILKGNKDLTEVKAYKPSTAQQIMLLEGQITNLHKAIDDSFADGAKEEQFNHLAKTLEETGCNDTCKH